MLPHATDTYLGCATILGRQWLVKPRGSGRILFDSVSDRIRNSANVGSQYLERLVELDLTNVAISSSILTAKNNTCIAV